jgi:hypothetical protein
MKLGEAEAIIGYLEFHLLTLVENAEKHVSDPDVIGGLYDHAYSILNDFEQTLTTQMLIDNAELQKAR